MTDTTRQRRLRIWTAILGVTVVGAAIFVAGCAAPPPPPPPAPAAPPPAPGVVAPPPIVAPPPPVVQAPPAMQSAANTPREFRRDAAGHLYRINAPRIFKGRMPPLLYAVGVYEVEIDGRGNVTKTSWLRAPTHAPEVMAEIDRLVRAASPYPAPVKMGRVTYTDTWLWDKSGRFQLDTLTEGQN